ncbi:lycopene cyclase family protein [Actinophytocola sp.]|uniref:lycopene cyclase family protein n=1 Tax=Actinophytocola sp. TaxID=1872138 RepID=UPI002E191ABB
MDRLASDVLVVGAGPAGWAVAAGCAERGLDTLLVDPYPQRRWAATYGMWAEECALLPAGSRWVEVGARVVAVTERVLARRYAVLDNESVQAAVGGRGVRVVEGAVAAVAHGPRGNAVALTSGRLLAAAAVVDASGAGRVLSGGPVPGQRVEQTAFGVVIEEQRAEATFMDWRPPPGFDGSTFLYAVPLPNGRTLVEETSLARRPGMTVGELRARLAARGVPLTGEVEWVRFPVDLPPPRARAGVVPFGVAAGLVHPATGYSVAEAFRLAPGVAAAIADALDRSTPDRAVRAARRVVWTPRARVVRGLRRRGLAVLLGLPPDRVAEFFEVFFGLPVELQRRYLGGREDVGGTAAAMARVFAGASPALRGLIVRHAFRPPGVV